MAVKGKPVDVSECPRHVDVYKRCRCGKCALCDWPKHTAIHAGILGDTTRELVYGHTFQPQEGRND